MTRVTVRILIVEALFITSTSLEKMLPSQQKLGEYYNSFKNSRFGRTVIEAFTETVVFIFFLAGIAVLHWFLDKAVGKDAKLLDRIPVGYIIDIGHILAASRYFVGIVKDIVKIIKE